MWYLFLERHPEPNRLIESTDRESLLRQKAAAERDGWTGTILDEEERRRYAHLTAQLIEAHPDLAV